MNKRRLARLRVEPELVVRHIVGLRPFRRSGFNVGIGRLDGKIVIHNYGHGGGGVSLSWGTAQLASEHARGTEHRRAAVLGCGVIGLTTARVLQDQGFDVTIFAREVPPHTTSNVAGASWAPFTVFDQDCLTPSFAEMFRRAASIAYRSFEALVGPRFGIAWRDTYVLSDGAASGFATPSMEDELVSGIRPAPRRLDRGDHPFGGLTATIIRTLHIEPPVFLDALLADFRGAGGQLVVRDLHDLASVAALPQKLVLNCTGLGACGLFGDDEMQPIKGQLALLPAQPDVDYLTIGPGDLYMMPRRDGVVLGGTHERGAWSLTPDPHEARRIIDGHRRLFDAMTP
jgi:glycine/D-amino acid oxidase-like deaminating enzyme